MNKTAFSYCNDTLCAEAVPLEELAEDMATPFCCTSVQQLQQNFRAVLAPFEGLAVQARYTVKAKPSLTSIRTFADLGAGAAIASAGELVRALEGDVLPPAIVFSGFAKTRDDITAALIAGISQIHADSIMDLNLMDSVGMELGRVVPVGLRVDLGLLTAPSRRTVTGFALDQVADALQVLFQRPALTLAGLAVSLGAYLPTPSLFERACERVETLVRLLRAEGVAVDRLDVGSFPPDSSFQLSFAEAAAMMRARFGPLGLSLSFEAGRRLVDDASILVARVVHAVQSKTKPSVVLDAGAQDLLYPAQSDHYEVLPLRVTAGQAWQRVTVWGSVAGETESLLEGEPFLPILRAGDLVGIFQTGISEGVWSALQGQALMPEILVSGARSAVIRRRVAVAEQMGWELIPDWIGMDRAA